MDQVVVRLESMPPYLEEVSANPDHSNNWQNAELCYLQIRKICEYTALAVLMAHDLYDENFGKNLMKEWHASEIFGRLLKLNPHAFPTAIIVSFDKNGSGQHHVELTERQLGSKELATIYGQCGDRLHVGSLKRLIDNRIPPFDLGEITVWRNRLIEMLNNHMIMLPEIGMMLIVSLKGDEAGKARIIFTQANGPFVINGDPKIYGL